MVYFRIILIIFFSTPVVFAFSQERLKIIETESQFDSLLKNGLNPDITKLHFYYLKNGISTRDLINKIGKSRNLLDLEMTLYKSKNNKIDSLHQFLLNFPNLRSIRIVRCDLPNFSLEYFKYNRKINSLDLTDVKITTDSLLYYLGYLDSLSYLVLESCGLKEIKLKENSFQFLFQIILNKNQIETFNFDLLKLPRLRNLFIEDNHLKKFKGKESLIPVNNNIEIISLRGNRIYTKKFKKILKKKLPNSAIY